MIRMSAHLERNGPDAARQNLGPLVAEHKAGLEPKVRVIACGVLVALLPAGAAWAAFSNISGMGWVALALALLTLIAAAGLILERNGQPEVLPWSDVKCCTERNVNVHYSVRLQLLDNRLITLDATFRGHHLLGVAVRKGVTGAALARA